MPYLIDGHNLIPKMGLDMSSYDDEMALVERLNIFCRLSRRSMVEVYFDNAHPGGTKRQKIGMVTTHFVRRPMIADEAIRLRLKSLKNDAKNWTVVSSDQRVQAEARSVGAKILSANEFAQTVMEILRTSPGLSAESLLSAGEIDEWMNLFGQGNGDSSKL